MKNILRFYAYLVKKILRFQKKVVHVLNKKSNPKVAFFVPPRREAITCPALRAQVALAYNLPIEDIVIKSTLLSPAIRVALYSLLDA